MTKYIKNVTFQGELGYKLKFDGNRDVYGQYQIYLFREKWKLKRYTQNMIRKIASWDCKVAKFLYFYEHLGNIPMSTCDKDCFAGYGKEPRETYVSVALDVSNAKTTNTMINIHKMPGM